MNKSRKTQKFRKMLHKYEAMSLSKRYSSNLISKMMDVATSFSDWTSIFQYGNDSIRIDAQRNMEKTVFLDKEDKNVQLNIIELFMVIDQADKEKFLRRYLRKFHSKDSLLFALEMTEDARWDEYWDTHGLVCDIRSQLREEYCRGSDLVIEQHLKYRYKRTEKLRKKSTFNP